MADTVPEDVPPPDDVIKTAKDALALFSGDLSDYGITCILLDRARSLSSTPPSREWRTWAGGKDADDVPPGVDPWGPVEYRLRNGEEAERMATSIFWHHTGEPDDVVAYRLPEPLPSPPVEGAVYLSGMIPAYRELLARAESAEAKVRELETALRPFTFPGMTWTHGDKVVVDMLLVDIYRARALIAKDAALATPAPLDAVADLILRLLLCADDPMWDAHAEISKSTLRATAAALERQVSELRVAEVALAEVREALKRTGHKLCEDCGRLVSIETFGGFIAPCGRRVTNIDVGREPRCINNEYGEPVLPARASLSPKGT